MMKLVASCILVVALVLPSQAAVVLSSGSTGYEYFPGFGFCKFYSESQVWVDAVQTCIADGGQLGVISSDEEAQLYKNIIARHAKSVYFYVGLTEFHDSRDFLSLDGVPVEETGYSKWAAGEPNNANGLQEKCGSILQNAELNDIACNKMLPFICELKYPASHRVA